MRSYESIDIIFLLVMGMILIILGLSVPYEKEVLQTSVFSLIEKLMIAYFAYKRGVIVKK